MCLGFHEQEVVTTPIIEAVLNSRCVVVEMIRCSLLVQCILYSTTGLQVVSSSLTKCFSKNENEDSPGK